MVGVWRGALPLTLTLSPLAGRGDVPCERWKGTDRLRHIPFAPRAGVRRTGRDPWLDPWWRRQPDEGPAALCRVKIYRFGATRQKKAPCGSVAWTIQLPPGTSIGPWTILPPPDVRRSVAASRVGTMK